MGRCTLHQDSLWVQLLTVRHARTVLVAGSRARPAIADLITRSTKAPGKMRAGFSQARRQWRASRCGVRRGATRRC